MKRKDENLVQIIFIALTILLLFYVTESISTNDPKQNMVSDR